MEILPFRYSKTEVFYGQLGVGWLKGAFVYGHRRGALRNGTGKSSEQKSVLEVLVFKICMEYLGKHAAIATRMALRGARGRDRVSR